MHTPPRRSSNKWWRRTRVIVAFLTLGFVGNLAVCWGMQALYERGAMKQTAPLDAQRLRTRRVSALIGTQRVHVSWAPWLRWHDIAWIESTAPGQRVWVAQSDDAPRVTERLSNELPSWIVISDEEFRRDYEIFGDLPSTVRFPPQFGATPTPTRVRRQFIAFGMPFRANVLTNREVHFRDPVSTMAMWRSDTPNRSAPVITLWPPSVRLGGNGLPFRPVWSGAVLNAAFYGLLLYALSRIPIALRRRFRRKRDQCVQCGYSLLGLTRGECPECGATGVALRRMPVSVRASPSSPN